MKATAFAPATVGNVGVGFDIMGHALDAVGDRVTVRKIAEPEVRVAQITGVTGQLPTQPEQNTATAGLIILRHDRNLDFGFEVSINKGIPLGSGMGGSAASAAGAVVAASALLETPLSRQELLEYGLIGEEVASGAAHADNLAPCLFGGLQLVTGGASPRVRELPVPEDILCVLVHPNMRLDTRRARAVLDRGFELGTSVEQSGLLAQFLVGCYESDHVLIGTSLRDVLVEPLRASLIPGFDRVQQAAMDAGALGCTISGAGPSVFAWCRGSDIAEHTRDAMVHAFEKYGGLATRAYISPVRAPGARLLEDGDA